MDGKLSLIISKIKRLKNKLHTPSEIPCDIAQHYQNKLFHHSNFSDYESLLYRCYGRTQYFSAVGEKIAELINKDHNFNLPRNHGGAARKLQKSLAREGYHLCEPLLSNQQISDLRDYAQKTPCLNAQNQGSTACDGVKRYLNKGAEDFGYGGYSNQDAINAPHLLELATSTDLVNKAVEYLGAPPTKCL